LNIPVFTTSWLSSDAGRSIAEALAVGGTRTWKGQAGVQACPAEQPLPVLPAALITALAPLRPTTLMVLATLFAAAALLALTALSALTASLAGLAAKAFVAFAVRPVAVVTRRVSALISRTAAALIACVFCHRCSSMVRVRSSLCSASVPR
jgi:hypothetical protein